jgi:carbon storage regulator
MLVLTRKENERIRLGDSIVLTVVRVSGDKVRLGIEAPASVVVLRDELKPRGSGKRDRVTGEAQASESGAGQQFSVEHLSAEQVTAPEGTVSPLSVIPATARPGLTSLDSVELELVLPK